MMKNANYTWADGILKKSYPSWVGIDKIFYDAIHSCLPANSARPIILDVGCGKNSPLAEHGKGVFYSVGMDLALDEIRANGDLDDLIVADGAALPFGSGAFDIIISKTAIEHMKDPAQFFEDVCRILKPGGRFVWATSNIRSVPIVVSYLTPIIVHKWVYKKLFGNELALEQFPTYYRANTQRKIERKLASAGFAKIAIYKSNWPQYFAFCRWLFRIMIPVHRWMDRLGLQILQVHLIGIYQKG
jgi:SAM-dependent methyltransferase